MTWRCVPVACWHKAPHIAAAAFGVLVAAHPQPAGTASCRCHMVWYPDAPAATTHTPRDITAPTTHPLNISAPPRFDPAILIPAPVQHLDAGSPLLQVPTTQAQPPSPTSAPEPPTWTLFGVGAAFLILARRRTYG